ncbi:helix-turn-helix domain-containing protein [Streptomyces cacaoi]|uniref:HTH arsR-type domain-containing protein n=1 Tax=Streptomyces cacaoi TaxID=1898 RepID=A0A4Y3QTW8_STRCI|nr:helix-turn-helix domain-containing protein [Streptomyces cacaoi]NNG86555.1 helix-turn-helix domain-containing protein [Streptomyces cacaoi]GEB48844.1 hypothetical protein SCA03_13950 [Streptomyces cacaoi]
MATANLLLHPVRLRILQTLVGSDPMTTAQLRERLPDIAPATMYRHIAVLAREDVLEVVEERKVRGTVERSYRVRQEHAVIARTAREEMTLDDHRQAFTAFSAAVLADFERYLSHEDARPAEEGVVARQGAVWLTDEEFAALVEEIEAAVRARAEGTPTEGRRRHIFSYAIVPDRPGKKPDVRGGGAQDAGE